MFFRKPLPVKRGASRRITISNFAGGIDSVSGDDFVGTSTSRLSYNVNGESGVLRENKGVRVFGLPLDGVETPVTAEGKKIKKVWYFRRFNSEANRADDRILFLSYDNHLYGVSTSGGKVEKITETAFCEEPKAVNYRLKGKDVMIFCSAADDMKVYDGNTLTVAENAPKVDCACLHYDRLFVTTLNDKNTIMFSDDLDPTGWEVGPDEAGYITMTDERGAIVGIISFLNYLYVFREYGISRLTAYGAQESFNLNHLFLTTGKIVKDTVRVCGETVIFLTEQGLFQFDGSNAKKILSNLDGLFEGCDNGHATAAYVNGRYYLACNLNFDDGFKTQNERNGCVNNAVVEIDLFNGGVRLMRGLDVVSLAGINGDGINELLLCSGENQPSSVYIGRLAEGGKFFDKNSLKVWVCPTTDLNNTVGRKQLIDVTLTTKENLTMVVKVDGIEHFYDVTGQERGQRVAINLYGEDFGVTFFADTEKLWLSRPQFTYKEYDR